MLHCCCGMPANKITLWPPSLPRKTHRSPRSGLPGRPYAPRLPNGSSWTEGSAASFTTPGRNLVGASSWTTRRPAPAPAGTGHLRGYSQQRDRRCHRGANILARPARPHASRASGGDRRCATRQRALHRRDYDDRPPVSRAWSAWHACASIPAGRGGASGTTSAGRCCARTMAWPARPLTPRPAMSLACRVGDVPARSYCNRSRWTRFRELQERPLNSPGGHFDRLQ